MSFDLTRAVDAGARALYEKSTESSWDDARPLDQLDVRTYVLPVVEAAVKVAATEALRDMAAELDRGPTFPMPPSIISQLIRERADQIGGE